MHDHFLIRIVLLPWHVEIDSGLLADLFYRFISKDLSHYCYIGTHDPKLRLFVLLMINVLLILAFRNWALGNEAFCCY